MASWKAGSRKFGDSAAPAPAIVGRSGRSDRSGRSGRRGGPGCILHQVANQSLPFSRWAWRPSLSSSRICSTWSSLEGQLLDHVGLGQRIQAVHLELDLLEPAVLPAIEDLGEGLLGGLLELVLRLLHRGEALSHFGIDLTTATRPPFGRRRRSGRRRSGRRRSGRRRTRRRRSGRRTRRRRLRRRRSGRHRTRRRSGRRLAGLGIGRCSGSADLPASGLPPRGHSSGREAAACADSPSR